MGLLERDDRLVEPSLTGKDVSPELRRAVDRFPLSEGERAQRAAAVRFANASIALEGFTVSEAARHRAEKFMAGEIDLAEFLRVE